MNYWVITAQWRRRAGSGHWTTLNKVINQDPLTWLMELRERVQDEEDWVLLHCFITSDMKLAKSIIRDNGGEI